MQSIQTKRIVRTWAQDEPKNILSMFLLARNDLKEQGYTYLNRSQSERFEYLLTLSFTELMNTESFLGFFHGSDWVALREVVKLRQWY